MNMAQKEEFESAVTASEYTTGIRIKKNDRDDEGGGQDAGMGEWR